MNLHKRLGRGILIFVALLSVEQLAISQDYKLTGKIIDQSTQQPLIGANVAATNLEDTLQVSYATTGVDGEFTIARLKKKTYRLSVTYLGYNKNVQNISVLFRDQSVGNVALRPKVEQLQGVTVVGTPPQAVLKGDTTEFNASSFKVNADANVEDLVKKMPGVTVENGTVKAQGEDVKKVLVDGKPFFGDDPSIALKNLPAELIEKVQIFDQMSEQSQLTGFNDGQTTKTMNVVTRNNVRNGQFGKISAAYGNEDRYSTSANLSRFRGSERLSFTASSNNVNQQSFGTSDFLGAMGGTSMFGGSGSGGGGNRQSSGGGGNRSGGGNQMSMGGGGMSQFMGGGSQNGISTVNSIGINYSNTLSKKLELSGSYFFNNMRNKNDQISSTENILNADTSRLEDATSNSKTKNFNNRLNFRVEWTIDSMNTLFIIPSVNFQSNTSNSFSDENQSVSSFGTVNPLLRSIYSSDTETEGYSISNRMTYRHKFAKKGRTVSLDLNTTFNERTPYSTSTSSNTYYTSNNMDSTSRITSTINSGHTINTNLAYSEPIGKISQIQINVANSYSKTYSYRRTSDLDDLVKEYFKIDTLSNKYTNNFITNRIGLAYRIQQPKLNASAGFEVQDANLSGDQTYPKTSNVDQRFTNILPNAQINYRITQQHNLIVNYNTSTNPPSISQMQNVAEYSSNRTSVTIGNPNLEPQYQHSLMSRITHVNRTKGSNFFVLIGGTISQNSIGNSTIYKDTIQITMPVNKGTGYNFRSMANYGFPLKAIKCNLNVSGGYNYSRTPGFINGKENIANTTTLTQSLVLSSNISEKIDFTLSGNGNYNIVKNSVSTQTNNNYYSQNLNARVNWTFWKDIVFQGELANKLYTGLSSSSYNQNVTTVNVGAGKKFMKNKAAELRLTVYDLFNKNTSVSRTITSNQITDQQSTILSRYALLSFTYTFRNFKSGSAPERGPRGEGFGGPQFMGPPPTM
jgi:hypothetical protein